MIEELDIFVEGATDYLYVKNVFGGTLSKLCKRYNIVEYRKKTDKKINDYIKTIKSVPTWDYIFIADQDGNLDKKKKIKQQYKYLDDEKIFLSVYEIESWILAGISDKIKSKYKISFYLSDTSCITKEQFNNMIPTKIEKLEFISDIISNYDLKNAVTLNSSLCEFSNYLNNKKAS